jgi:molecular chaperone DnaK (HSP70)
MPEGKRIMSKITGIDPGRTNSVVSVMEGDEENLVESEFRQA